MARRKKGIPGLSFSWKRATGLSQAKARISRKTGVPLSKQARQRKLGSSLGCVVPFAFLVSCLFAGAFAVGSLLSGSVYAQAVPSTPEGKLAAIDHNRLDVSPQIIAPYGAALTRLEGKCPQSRSLIGDYAVKSVETLEQKGFHANNLVFLQMMNKAIPDEMPDDTLSCAELAALVVTLWSD